MGLGWLLGRVLLVWQRGNALSETGAGVVAFAGVLLAHGATDSRRSRRIVSSPGLQASACSRDQPYSRRPVSITSRTARSIP